MTDIEIVNAPERQRYEASIDGEVAGFAQYMLTDELVVFTHTEVDPRFEGKGVGSALARFAVTDVRDAGRRKVLPICPFIKAWIDRHPELAGVLYRAPKSTVVD